MVRVRWGIPEERVVSMPRAEQAMPNMCARVKLTKMQTAMTIQGMMADLYPRASPKMMSVAAPVLQESATSCRQSNTSFSGVHIDMFCSGKMRIKYITVLVLAREGQKGLLL